MQDPIDQECDSEMEICVLRLSALGDASHALAVIQAIQQQRPNWKITWILGAFEAKLFRHVPDITIVPFHKKLGLSAYRQLSRDLKGKRFDILLHMQLSLRANLAAMRVKAKRRIGYDRARSKEGHGWVIHERIEPADGPHVLDTLFQFLPAIGLKLQPPAWHWTIAEKDAAFAQSVLTDSKPHVIISPCSSHPRRNWRAEYYAQVADAAHRLNLSVVLCGGPSQIERDMADTIIHNCQHPPLDLVGKDTLPQLMALLAQAALVITPDSGPAHLANMVGTPVLGLYASTDAKRSGPYHSQKLTINRFPEAWTVFGKKGKRPKWGTRLEQEGVMDLITPESVIARMRGFFANDEADGPDAQ